MRPREMQRIINDPDRVVDDMLEGYAKANADRIKTVKNPRVLVASHTPEAPKVGVITGGGSGHEPAFLGYVGKNMLDAVAVGEIFSSPTAQTFLDAARAADRGKGVACLYGNYAGDNMNVKMMARMAAKEGITVRTVVANDDVASAPATERERRRGVAGEIMMWKCGGAKAAMGGSLDEVVDAAQKAVDHTKSVGIGLTSCVIPAAGRPNFEIKEGDMELGIGHHGEAGVCVVPLESAQGIARRMWNVIEQERYFQHGDETAVLISGLGATPLMELYILYHEIEKILMESGISVLRSYVGNLFTSLEMMGASLTVTKLDGELKELLGYEADCTGLVRL